MNGERIQMQILFENIHECIHEYLEYFKIPILCLVLPANMIYLYKYLCVYYIYIYTHIYIHIYNIIT